MSEVMNRIVIGEKELYKSDEQLGQYTLDGSFVPLVNDDSSITFLNTSYSEQPYFHRFIGSADDPVRNDVQYEMDYNGCLDCWPAGIWIMSAYRFPDGLLAGFCHRELVSRTDPGFGNCFFVGLAVSKDGGKKWKYIGDILSNVLNGGHLMANMGGVPLLVREGYFYVYFNDADEMLQKRISAARMKIDETYECLKAERLPEVFKYTGTGMWKTHPMKGIGANILPDVGALLDSHSKGCYCRALDRYLLTMQSNADSKLFLFISKDCEHFDDYILVDEAEKGVFMQPYSFFVSADGDCSKDMNEVGSDFYIYYPHKGMIESGCDDERSYGHDDLYRRRARILPE